MPLAPTIQFTARDNDNDDSSTSIHVPSGNTLAQYTEFAGDFAALLEGVMIGALNPTARLSIPVDISALTGNVAADTSDVEEVASFQFADANNEPVDLNIPALNLTDDLLAASDALDTADTDIAALITAMESGLAVTGGTIQPSSIAEADIQDTFYARRYTRPSGKRRR